MISKKGMYFVGTSFFMYFFSFLAGNYVNLKSLFGMVIIILFAALFTFLLYLQTYSLYENYERVSDDSDKQPSGVCWQDGTCL